MFNVPYKNELIIIFKVLKKTRCLFEYKHKVWRAVLSWIFRARKAWWSHLQARRRSLRAC